jgi:hypothetical protein
MARSLILIVLGVLISILLSNTANAQSTGWTPQNPSNCSDQFGSFDAFIPGMRGHGACTRGGFVPGTTVISVTNLNTSGSGSFAAAVQSGCPKVIIFDVAGHVDMGSTSVTHNNTLAGCDNASIVGASAPGQFALTGGGDSAALEMGGGDITVDHLVVTTHGRGSNPGSQSRDALSIGWLNGGKANKLFINMAIIWGWDEDFQCYDQGINHLSTGTTLWQSIIGLGGFVDGGESHQFAHMNQFTCLQSTHIRNVYIHSAGRTPFTRGDGLLHANNISFNPGVQGLVSQPCGSSGSSVSNYRVNVINNFWLRGPDSTRAAAGMMDYQSATCKTGTVSIYENGNAVQTAVGQSIENCTNHGCSWTNAGNNWAGSPVSYATADGYVPETFNSSNDAELTTFTNNILANVGPRPTDRLSYIQTRVIDAVEAGLAGTGNMGTYLELGQTTMADEGGFAVLNTNTGSWDASAQCGGMPTGSAADNIQSSGLTGLHEWVIGCFYDNVMPAGYREDGIPSFPAPGGSVPVTQPNPPEFN